MIGVNTVQKWATTLGIVPERGLELDESAANRRAVVVAVSSTILLFAFFFWGRPVAFRGSDLASSVERAFGSFGSDYAGVLPYLYWGVTSLLARVLIPLALILYALKQSPRGFGFGLRGAGWAFGLYGLVYVAMLPLLVWASSLDAFQSQYPLYKGAVDGGLHFWLYQAGYAVQFVGIEAFFRGYLTFGLFPRLGLWAVAVMVVPYTLVHLGKPVLEVIAAVPAGAVLGLVALRARSFWPGAFLHIAVATTMDLLVMGRALGVSDLIDVVF